MYTFIIQCVYVDSQRKSWPKQTEARVTNEQTKERTHHVPFLNFDSWWKEHFQVHFPQVSFSSFTSFRHPITLLHRQTYCQWNESGLHRKEQLASINNTITITYKNVDFIHLYFCEATDSVQYRPPIAYQDVSSTNSRSCYTNCRWFHNILYLWTFSY